MKRYSPEDMDAFLKKGPPHETDFVRVGMDTGGVAAGADEAYEVFQAATGKSGGRFTVKRTGSIGMSFADPLVEVNLTGTPEVLYGHVKREAAEKIAELHLLQGLLVDDHIIASRQRSLELNSDVSHILVLDTSSDGGDKTEFVQFSLKEALKRQGRDDKVQVIRALDMGLYEQGVVVQLLPSRVTYSHVLAPDVDRIVNECVGEKKVLDDLLVKKKDLQERFVLRHCGIVDPESLEDYLAHGGYQGLHKALKGSPDKVLEEVKTSGLRGRGGAGFPTWLKWKLTREQQSDERYVICNADEGDPGAFMDRSVLEGDPHAVLEGMILSAYVIGATTGYFYIRAEYPTAIARIEKAIQDARAAGFLGKDILGSGFDFNAKIRLGAGAFVCGEETALIASVEGKRGSPSPRPPFPSVKGLFGKPTCISNVETLANVAEIVVKGGEYYAGFGVDRSKGTKVFAVTGKVKNAQLVEVPMGTTLRELVFDICGGVMDNLEIKGVQTGGPSGGVIPEKLLDTPISYETLQELGSIMGSGGMLIVSESDCMVDMAKFYLKFCVDESCGKCAPCRVGGYQMLQALDRISRGRGKQEDLDIIESICLSMQKASLCGLGQTAPNPVKSTLRYFKPEYQAYIEGGISYARKQAKVLAGKN